MRRLNDLFRSSVNPRGKRKQGTTNLGSGVRISSGNPCVNLDALPRSCQKWMALGSTMCRQFHVPAMRARAALNL
jgi:hypothetical protein